MKPLVIPFLFVALLSANEALAAPISAFSELEVNHSFVINNGNSPQGIDIGAGPINLIIERDAATFVDDPAAVTEDDIDVVVGNPFTDPPLAAEGARLRTTLRPGGTEGALARYHSTTTTEDDPDDDVFDITRRTVSQEGEANVVITSDPIAASAASSELVSRTYQFENTTDQLISFNIAGQFDASLGAQYNGIDGFARASAGIDLLFTPTVGADITYFPIAPYLTNIQDDDLGALAAEQLLIGSSGFSFTGSTSASGEGGTTTALLDAQIRYIFGISLDPNASLVMTASFRQANAVDYTPQPMAPVPVPASLPILLSALAGFAAIRQKSIKTKIA